MGIGNAGKFEHYLSLFRRIIVPWIHSRPCIAQLLQGGSAVERATFYQQTWNNRRWRALFRLFFSRFVLGRGGRDPRFFTYVEGQVAERLLERVGRGLVDVNPADNPYLQWIFTGYPTTALPLALRPEHFETIRANLDRLEWHQASLQTYLDTAPSRSIARFNLSDVFEYMSPVEYATTLQQLVRVGCPGGRLAYWNMLVPRRRPEFLAEVLHPLDELANLLHSQDKAIFYTAFVLEEILL
jgi:S-adenosylmethionine-diacylglycerol 3-amino-3-carboxypropyl transferase